MPISKSDRPGVLRGRTPSEVHWQALGRRCGHTGCGDVPAVEVVIYAPAKELLAADPQLVMRLAAANEGRIPLIDLVGPGGEPRQFIRHSHKFACRHHRKELEQLAAKAPSSFYVDVRRGPREVAPVVSVPA